MKKIAFLLSLGIVGGEVYGQQIIRVPSDDYPTIQAAIDAATTGDTVLVADGVYTGTENKNLTWSGKKITVRSENGPNNCIIDCENDGRGFWLYKAGDCGTISGFTIKRGCVNGINGNGGAIYCYYSSPVITNCIIVENTATAYGRFGGGGIWIWRSSPIITNCLIVGNNTNKSGGALHFVWSILTVTNCTIASNTAGEDGGGIRVFGGRPGGTITNCIIVYNSANKEGGGICCKYSYLDL